MFSKNVFEHVKVLFTGALLALGRRTVCALLRVLGLQGEKRFHKYHRVLSQVKWSPLAASRLLLDLLVRCFCARAEPLVFALDETLERRRGVRIQAKGVYHDPVRSSKHQKVNSSGLRWLSMMLLCRVPWAQRIWALPFFTVLAPSQRYFQGRNKAHKKLTDWARQMTLQLWRWLRGRTLVVVADSAYAALELLGSVRRQVCFITRLRLDAALYAEPQPKPPGRSGPQAAKGERLASLQQVLADPLTPWQSLVIPQWYGEAGVSVQVTTATALWYHKGQPPVPIRWVLLRDAKGKKEPAGLLSTDARLSAQDIIHYFIRRWTVEVTFAESRAHLGMETQRGWSERTIQRSTPCVLGLFSLTALWADGLQKSGSLAVQQTAWYQKRLPTFSDALAAVRNQIWQARNWGTSGEANDMIQIPRHLLNELTSILARAA